MKRGRSANAVVWYISSCLFVGCLFQGFVGPAKNQQQENIKKSVTALPFVGTKIQCNVLLYSPLLLSFEQCSVNQQEDFKLPERYV
jgi:hypothetical protein